MLRDVTVQRSEVDETEDTVDDVIQQPEDGETDDDDDISDLDSDDLDDDLDDIDDLSRERNENDAPRRVMSKKKRKRLAAKATSRPVVMVTCSADEATDIHQTLVKTVLPQLERFMISQVRYSADVTVQTRTYHTPSFEHCLIIAVAASDSGCFSSGSGECCAQAS